MRDLILLILAALLGIPMSMIATYAIRRMDSRPARQAKRTHEKRRKQYRSLRYRLDHPGDVLSNRISLLVGAVFLVMLAGAFQLVDVMIVETIQTWRDLGWTAYRADRELIAMILGFGTLISGFGAVMLLFDVLESDDETEFANLVASLNDEERDAFERDVAENPPGKWELTA